MKLKTETGEMLVLDEAGKFYISESADSDTSIEVSEANALLESGDLEMVAEDSDEVLEAAAPMAKSLKKKKIKADGSGEIEVFEDDEDADEDKDDEIEEDTRDEDDDEKYAKESKKLAKEEIEIEIDIKEDIAALFDGQELTEDFKARTTLVFETAVKAKVKENLAAIEEGMELELSEKMDSLLEDVTSKLDGYLDYMVTEWVSENEVAIENGLKNEILEGFVNGLQTLFVENYIDVPEDKLNVVDEQASEIASLKEELDAEMNKNIKACKSLDEALAKEIFGTVAEELTMTQVEKLASLAEGVVFDNAETYTEKLETLREAYFPSEGKKEEVIAEGKTEVKAAEEMSDSMKRVMDSLSNSKEASILGA
jgi:hypothetical protein